MKSKPYLPLFASAAMLSASAILTLALSLGGSAQAANFIWDGTGNWTDLSWSPGSVTGPTASTDSATVNSGTVTITSLTIDSAISIATGATLEANAQAPIGNVVLTGNLTGSGILNKTGGYSLFLQGDNSGFSGTINATASNTFFAADSAGSAAADWVLSSGAKIVNNMSGTGHLIKLGSLAGTGGTLGGGNASGAAATFEIGGNGNSTNFGGEIVDTPSGFGGGTATITKVGSGTLTLTGANNYTGGTTINAGTLNVSGGTFGTGAVTINNGGTLKTSGEWAFGGANGYGIGGNLIPSVTINTGGTLDFGSGSANGIINLVLNGGTVTGGGGFAGLFGALFLFNGNEQITAGGATTSTIAARLCLDGNNNTITVNTGSALNITSEVANITGIGGSWTNIGGFIKAGAGTLTLSGVNSYTGNTTVNQGTLSLGDGTTNTALVDTADVTVAAGCTLNLNYNGTDTIDELWLGGVQRSPGIYGAGTYSGVTISGAGTLTVLNGPSADPFADWMFTNYPAIVSPDNAPGADPDHDGIPNLLEYVLQGGNPSVSTTGTLPTLDASGVNFVFTYFRRAAATGTTQTFEYGTTLTGWTPVAIPGGSGVTVTPNTPSAGIDKVEIIVAKGINTKLFGRLQVVK